jgi:hypothetical protein
MKPKRVRVITVAVFFWAAVFMTDSSASITDVNILPSLPTPLDAISIVTFGIESSGPVFVTDSVFRSEDSSLNLDIYLDVGFASVITPWSHIENIGTLPIGFYGLTVRTWEESIETDTYSTSFEVVPEPVTILLLATGIFGISRKGHKR